MCGIVGQISKNNIKTSLIEMLEKLEYRGYDSSGICFFYKNKLNLEKQTGQIHNLKTIIQSQPISFNCGIAHTRWATHGEVSKDNAHPQMSNDGSWAVVHNGIIENYLSLKQQLKNNGYNFFSQTDTEVIPNLITNQKQTSPLKKFCNAINKLEGSYAIVAVCSSLPNTLFLAKKHSPLYVASFNGEVICASDPICFSGKVESYYTLLDDEFCMATPQKLTFLDKNHKKITKKTKKIENFTQTATKNNYEYFAEKEIEENKIVLKNIIDFYSNSNTLKNINKQFINNIQKIYLVGCGTSYHACKVGATLIQNASGLICLPCIASEFISSNPLLNSSTLCIFVSQSGETADTLLSLNHAKQKGCPVLSLVNVPYSSMATKSDVFLPLCAGAEIAVVSTKAYNAMLYVFFILAEKIKSVINKTKINFTKLNKLLNLNIENLKKQAKKVKKIINKSSKVFFIGKNYDYITSQEASLKLKEISYINSVSLPSGELKHGTLALVDNKTIVFITSTNHSLLSKNLNSASEVKARGAKVIFVTNEKIENNSNIDYIVPLENFDENLMPAYSIIFYQYLAVYTCLKFGLNPDKPRNLAKSVTVE